MSDLVQESGCADFGDSTTGTVVLAAIAPRNFASSSPDDPSTPDKHYMMSTALDLSGHRLTVKVFGPSIDERTRDLKSERYRREPYDHRRSKPDSPLATISTGDPVTKESCNDSWKEDRCGGQSQSRAVRAVEVFLPSRKSLKLSTPPRAFAPTCKPFSRFWSSIGQIDVMKLWYARTSEIVDAKRDSQAVQDISAETRVSPPSGIGIVLP